MCGIAGMFGNPDSSVVHRMINLIQHRGPDGHNFWADENISLGHSRLAIVDLSGSQQPMKGVNGQILVANGEIYNYERLRMESKGLWNTNGDSESILALHSSSISGSLTSTSAANHVSWISKLNGMYGFALWDTRRKELILARDQFGIKPLYIYQDNNVILFSSEKKAILKFNGLNLNINKQALLEYVWFGNPLGNNTIYNEINELDPGCFMKISRNKTFKGKFFSIDTLSLQPEPNYFFKI